MRITDRMRLDWLMREARREIFYPVGLEVKNGQLVYAHARHRSPRKAIDRAIKAKAAEARGNKC